MLLAAACSIPSFTEKARTSAGRISSPCALQGPSSLNLPTPLACELYGPCIAQSCTSKQRKLFIVHHSTRAYQIYLVSPHNGNHLCQPHHLACNSCESAHTTRPIPILPHSLHHVPTTAARTCTAGVQTPMTTARAIDRAIPPSFHSLTRSLFQHHAAISPHQMGTTNTLTLRTCTTSCTPTYSAHQARLGSRLRTRPLSRVYAGCATQPVADAARSHSAPMAVSAAKRQCSSRKHI